MQCDAWLTLQLAPRTRVAVREFVFPCSIRPGHSLPRNRAGARRRREIELRAMRAGTALVSESPRGVAGRREFVVELIGMVHGHTGI